MDNFFDVNVPLLLKNISNGSRSVSMYISNILEKGKKAKETVNLAICLSVFASRGVRCSEESTKKYSNKIHFSFLPTFEHHHDYYYFRLARASSALSICNTILQKFVYVLQKFDLSDP